MTASIVWFRQDLRLADNPALHAALGRRAAVVPVYIWAPEEEGDWPPGAASRWWLHHSLVALDASLRKRGSRLVLRRGPSGESLRRLADETGADRIFWNRRYEPASVRRDRELEAGLPSESFNSALLFEPWEVRTKTGGPYRVFTPFWNACLAARDTIPAPRRAPGRLQPPRRWPAGLRLEELQLRPAADWADGFARVWTPGERGAGRQLTRFLRSALAGYDTGRDRPDQPATSRLSPHLHFGEVGPRQIWHAVRRAVDHAGRPRLRRTRAERGRAGRLTSRVAWAWLRELAWREFAYHLLFHFPHTAAEPLRPEFSRVPWRRDRAALRAWQRGRTGYRLVDAGMRELWATGWMHNRVRMVAASFLVKDLLLRWQDGARWFWDTLVDADLANNTLGWQWTAGCGADAAPFFRVFNPETQAKKFDPDGRYVRRWIPELGSSGYPAPMVDHGEARARALDAFAAIRA